MVVQTDTHNGMTKMEMTDVATFVRIVNATQTQALHEWDEESLRRSLAWAHVMETLVQNTRKNGESAMRTLDNELATRLAGAALPTVQSKRISSAQLLSATRVVCESILLSPWLVSHPNRHIFMSKVLHYLHTVHEDHAQQVQTDAVVKSCSELFIKKQQTQRYNNALSRVAECVATAHKPSLVRVGSIEFEMLPASSFALQHQSLKLKALARTLQMNACAAASLSDISSESAFLDRLQQQLRSSARDVVETIVWAVVLEWPTDQPVARRLRTKITDATNNFMEMHSPKSHFLLHPWLAALLAQHSARFAATYIPSILTAGLLLDRGHLRDRLGALVLLSPCLATAVEKQLEGTTNVVLDLLAT